MESPEPKSKKKAKTKKKMVTEPPSEPVHEPVQAKIEVVSSDPSKMPPFIGYFTSGFDPVKSSSVPMFKCIETRECIRGLS